VVRELNARNGLRKQLDALSSDELRARAERMLRKGRKLLRDPKAFTRDSWLLRQNGDGD
jgi:hypothetical protein